MRSDIKKKIEAFQSGGNGADAAEDEDEEDDDE